MKKLFLTSAAILMLSGAVQAADIVAPTATNFDWSGFYLGANGGIDWSKSDWESVGGVNAHPSGNGGLVGGQFGYNVQFQDGLLIGAEAMLDFAGINGNGAWSTPGNTANYKSDYLGAARLRLGYGADRVLFYGTGGAAFTNFQYNTVPFGTGYSNSSLGWTVGAGVEFAMTDHLIAGVEYDYYNFGTHTAQAGQLDSVPTNVSTTAHAVTARLSYKF